MSLFHRRMIKRMLDACKAILSPDQYVQLVNRLNKEDKQSLDAQWELAILHSLSLLGAAEYEPNINGKHPDVRWSNNDNSEVVILDVRTVSDNGLEGKNPHLFYREELSKCVRKLGLDPRCFSFYSNGHLHGVYGNQEMILSLPPKNESDRVFNKDFYDFLRHIKAQNPERYHVRITDKDTDITIYYRKDYTQAGSGGFG